MSEAEYAERALKGLVMCQICRMLVPAKRLTAFPRTFTRENVS